MRKRLTDMHAVRHDPSVARSLRSLPPDPGRRGSCVARRGYVLLETVVATGLLIVGLAVIGAQVQDADQTVRRMQRRVQAILLAQRQLGELEMGLVDLHSVDEVEEGDFGPRYPDYGWRLTTLETEIESMYLQRLDILHKLREGEYKEDEFDFESAETLYTVYAMHAVEPPVNFGEDLGLNDDELTELSDRFDELGIDGLDVDAFDPRILQSVDLEDMLATLPVVMDALGMDISQVTDMLPPEVLRQLQDSGLLDGEQVQGLLDSGGRTGESP